jgi:SAM-dependent methyltransferase
MKSIWRGKTLLRIMMNERCRAVSLSGKKVLDLGSGSTRGAYHSYFKDSAAEVFTVDIKNGSENHCTVDFEKDPLPFVEKSMDVVLSFNLFEHIFNHGQLIAEIYKVLKDDGVLIGFVPFFINYHPNPHDYFRYTDEALAELFGRAGFKESTIETIGGGPFIVHFNNMMLFIPRIARIILLPYYFLLDFIAVKLRPDMKKKFPIGYFFTVKKKR